ncbi:MAG: sensor histidine kinase, partial [Acetatifactor sp.]|nr:sensor histidine kinase [Acetatifactor sp.]
MKSFYKVSAVMLVVFAAVFALANLLLNVYCQPANGRPYRVEINRLALQIAESGLESVDLSECAYVTDIVEFGEGFYSSADDCVIREIKGELYRFDYSTDNIYDNSASVLIVNIILCVAAVAVAAVLLYIRAHILLPFEQLTSLPYELSKGNLTAPLKENKSRFFGKFLWGMDLLRENIEQRRSRELELQRERKTLLLALSHDIKTPLTVILGYLEILRMDRKEDEGLQKVEAKAKQVLE